MTFSITKVNKEQKETIIMGDFNIDYSRSNVSKDFKSQMSSYGFKQLVKTATRITKDTSSLIDLIFVNKPNSYPTVNVVSTSLSDHDLICLTRKINTQKYLARVIKCRDYSNYNPELLVNDIRQIDWSYVYNSNEVNKSVEYLSTQLKNAFDKHAPLIEKRVQGKPCPWIDEPLKRQMNARDRLLHRARANNDEASWNEYKVQRNRCTSAVRKAKASYNQRMLNDNRLNPRKFWNTIKSIFPTKPKVSSPRTDDAKHLVNCFAEYFSTVVSVLKKTAYPLIDFVWRYPKKTRLCTKSIFKFSYISSVSVEKELRNLKRNKAAGVDCLPPNLLKDCAREIASPISFIINKSLQTSTVPNGWKIAKICPIFKSGNAELVENYRPISVLPVLSKLLENMDSVKNVSLNSPPPCSVTQFAKTLIMASWSVVCFSPYLKPSTPSVTVFYSKS